MASKTEAARQLNVKLLEKPTNKTYDGIIIAVSHDHFKYLGVKNIEN